MFDSRAAVLAIRSTRAPAAQLDRERIRNLSHRQRAGARTRRTRHLKTREGSSDQGLPMLSIHRNRRLAVVLGATLGLLAPTGVAQARPYGPYGSAAQSGQGQSWEMSPMIA